VQEKLCARCLDQDRRPVDDVVHRLTDCIGRREEQATLKAVVREVKDGLSLFDRVTAAQRVAIISKVKGAGPAEVEAFKSCFLMLNHKPRQGFEAIMRCLREVEN